MKFKLIMLAVWLGCLLVGLAVLVVWDTIKQRRLRRRTGYRQIPCESCPLRKKRDC